MRPQPPVSRHLSFGEVQEPARQLWQHLEKQPVAATLPVRVPRKVGQAARMASRIPASVVLRSLPHGDERW